MTRMAMTLPLACLKRGGRGSRNPRFAQISFCCNSVAASRGSRAPAEGGGGGGGTGAVDQGGCMPAGALAGAGHRHGARCGGLRGAVGERVGARLALLGKLKLFSLFENF